MLGLFVLNCLRLKIKYVILFYCFILFNKISEAIEQMRAFGIPEADARQALIMSNGDVEMAINLYFERLQN